MQNISVLLALLAVLAASFIFWKLSQIKARGRCLIPLKWRVIISLAVLLLAPAIIFLGLAIAIILAIILIIGLSSFIINWLKHKRN